MEKHKIFPKNEIYFCPILPWYKIVYSYFKDSNVVIRFIDWLVKSMWHNMIGHLKIIFLKLQFTQCFKKI